MAADDTGNEFSGQNTTVLIRSPASAVVEDGRAHYLAVVAGERAGLRVELGGTPIVIGRVPPADLVIDDSQISRKHCRINMANGEVFATDLGSSNGTYLDGTRIAGTVLLEPGSQLQIGAHVVEHEYRSRKEVEASRELDLDLENARRYVQSLLPPPLEAGPVRTEWVLLPSARLGGDVIGYHMIDPDTFAIFLLDVSGHGTGAAMHAVSVCNVLRSTALPTDNHDPAKVAAYLNTLFQMSTHGGMYLTMWYGVYDIHTRKLRYCSAGHHPSYLVPPDRVMATPLKTPDIIIGAVPTFPFATQSIDVPEGSRLYVFSDGVFEIEGKDGRDWSIEDLVPMLLEPLVDGTPEPQRLLRAVRSRARRPEFDDDFTMLVATFA